MDDPSTPARCPDNMPVAQRTLAKITNIIVRGIGNQRGIDVLVVVAVVIVGDEKDVPVQFPVSIVDHPRSGKVHCWLQRNAGSGSIVGWRGDQQRL